MQPDSASTEPELDLPGLLFDDSHNIRERVKCQSFPEKWLTPHFPASLTVHKLGAAPFPPFSVSEEGEDKNLLGWHNWPDC